MRILPEGSWARDWGLEDAPSFVPLLWLWALSFVSPVLHCGAVTPVAKRGSRVPGDLPGVLPDAELLGQRAGGFV